MRILIVDTYYPRFLASHYAANPGLRQQDFNYQRASLLDACFGTSDFYSRHLNDMGHEAQDLIVNCVPLQAAWAKENNFSVKPWALKVPHRVYRLPAVGPVLRSVPGLLELAVNQIKSIKPDVLYCHDLSFFPKNILKDLKRDVKLIVGQIACPLPPDEFLQGYDLILTSFPHFVDRLRGMGISSEYFRIAFDTRVLEKLGKVPKDVDISFVGGISRHHANALSLLEYLAKTTPIRFFGYGAQKLSWSSPIRRRHEGEVWGLKMYRALARSNITINRHINVAENNANNMRLYEATGVGTLLITDRKDNLNQIFEIGKEILAYSSAEEAGKLVDYYMAHPDEARDIAAAGQARTLSEHTYRHRMQELVPILQRYLGSL